MDQSASNEDDDNYDNDDNDDDDDDDESQEEHRDVRTVHGDVMVLGHIITTKPQQHKRCATLTRTLPRRRTPHHEPFSSFGCSALPLHLNWVVPDDCLTASINQTRVD
jgi:hypothetical protein